MNIKGKLTATFKGEPGQLSDTLFGPSKVGFQIDVLNNIVVLSAEELSDEAFNTLMISNKVFKQKGKPETTELSFFLNNSYFQQNCDWNNVWFFNTRISNVQKIHRGYYFERFKNITLIDGLAGMAYNIAVFFPSLLIRSVRPRNTEVYIGYFEADFIAKFAPEVVSQQPEAEITQPENLSPGIIDEPEDSLLPDDSGNASPLI